ncbi:MAG: thermonuclease family protein [Candidatus Moraniibacteriota bacterium]|nr:MAG: thermonuclease family protein [Candidatus Moranbacteria bacterium]
MTVFLLAALFSLSHERIFPAPNERDTVQVERVVDGDTVKLSNGKTLRYIGIDTPETVDPRRGAQCFGKEASKRNIELVSGKSVRLEKDVSETDKYGRLLRYVYVGDTFVNEVLVRDGFARASAYPPDVAHQDLFREAEREAREARRGLWADGVCSDD